jgi:cysteine desulfurase
MTEYLDCNATTPIDPRVREVVLRYLDAELGNAASPHEFGRRSKAAVQRARDQVAAVAGARRHEVFFTSGATESNNLALLGLAEYGLERGKTHLVATQIEHASVLEPLRELERRGFALTLVPPDSGGRVDADALADALQPDTLLVSVMHVNHETGAVQPVAEIAERLAGRDAYFHIDAAQGFGKQLEPLRHGRIDLMSVSGHKIYGPQGVGALVARRRGGERPPLRPLVFGGGQELGLRPGTLPVALIAGLGRAAELAQAEHAERAVRCRQFRERLLAALAGMEAVVHGDRRHVLPHVMSLSVPGVYSDDAIEALAGVAAVSNGSACASLCSTASHVLAAMGVPASQAEGAIRLSWYHGSSPDCLDELAAVLGRLQRAGRVGRTIA